MKCSIVASSLGSSEELLQMEIDSIEEKGGRVKALSTCVTGNAEIVHTILYEVMVPLAMGDHTKFLPS